MRLLALTTITMIAFAANSLLTRAALAGGHIGPAEFATIRVVSGAVMLWLLLAQRAAGLPRRRSPDWASILGLVAYLLGFSFAYLQIDAGLGALVLFAVVQLTMFTGALVEGDMPPLRRWAGMALSLAGLAYLGWPQGNNPISVFSMGLMSMAAVGWGIYSLVGRRVSDPLSATAWNFIYAAPMVVGVAYFAVSGTGATQLGIVLAIASGAVTSGMGYALWYRVLPGLGATRAALAQLSAPVLAIAGGALFLSEPVTSRAIIASLLVLGGIALGVLPRKRQ